MRGRSRDRIVLAMTETTIAPPARTLYRDPDNSMFAGVCTAVARYTDTDPVIWRIVAVVLAAFGGTGLVLYALGWLLIPKLGNDTSVAEQWLRRRHRLSPVSLLVIGLVALALFAGLDDGNGLAAVVVLAAVAYLVHRDRQGRPLAPAYVPPPEAPEGESPESAPAAAGWTAPEGAPTPAGWPTPTPREPRPRSRLGAVTLSAAALVSGALVLARTYGADGLTPARILAVALLVVAAGLVVGTWIGRARWLVPIGILLSLALAATAATDDPSDALRGGIGDRTWVASQTQQSQTFRLGIGEATLDLTALAATGSHQTIRAHVGAGQLIVLVPSDVPLRLVAKADIGEFHEFGDTIADGDDVKRTRSYGPPGDPRVEVEADVTFGQVEVRHG